MFRGGLHFPADFADALLAPAAKPSAEQPGSAVLTGRELEALTLLAEGLSNRGVSTRPGISVRTTETHREHLSHKLNILTVADLTKYAIAHGLSSL